MVSMFIKRIRKLKVTFLAGFYVLLKYCFCQGEPHHPQHSLPVEMQESAAVEGIRFSDSVALIMDDQH